MLDLATFPRVPLHGHRPTFASELVETEAGRGRSKRSERPTRMAVGPDIIRY